MARQGFSRFKYSRAGYKAVQDSGAVQRILQQEADSRAGGANAEYGERIYRSGQIQGKFAKGHIVSCALPQPKSSRTEKWRAKDNAKRTSILENYL